MIPLATSNKQQATSNKQQATSNKQQATSNNKVVLYLFSAFQKAPSFSKGGAL
ncbi:hypothetical protein [Streptococcus ruminantium]|uniref:hypothetical protein n=1 Tax=Streptococcus ruminantium TaxID=1917441 RepID=UPI0012DC6BA9|nr:hypothetical protein [Streptococcus ruminantium]